MYCGIDSKEILDLFREEIVALGGRLTDEIHDERNQKLYVRSRLPCEALVDADDRLEAGIGLRSTPEEIEVRPYVYRVVCRNGALLSYSDDGRKIELSGTTNPDALLLELRQAIRAAASREAFEDFVERMRDSRHRVPDMEELILGLFTESGLDPASMITLLERFQEAETGDLFALGNAMTSLARDTADPELRWRRESAGAMVFARLLKPPGIRQRSATIPAAG